DWKQLVDPAQTLVIYMGLLGLENICKQLVAHGAAPELPVALIERGTTASQQIHIGTLASIADIIANRDVHAPTLLIVGNVVQLHDSLRWC
ncbi:MAG: siroheme synthase, partial [Gammaproteobacteria bacterium]|nr:siroheme synthase [Gammaproteobacteria bacterium]